MTESAITIAAKRLHKWVINHLPTRMVTLAATTLLLSASLIIPRFILAGHFGEPDLPHEQFGQWADENLTSTERDWLSRHDSFRLGVGVAFPPFQYVEDGPNGPEFKGMVSDYLNILSNRLGVQLEPVFGITFAEALKLGREKKIDIFPCVAYTPERAEFLTYTDDYISYPLVIITADNAPFIGSVDDLTGHKVAIVKTLATYSKFENDYPDLGIEYVFANDVGGVLKAVSLGKADACVVNLAVAGYLIHNMGLGNLKVAAPTPWRENKLSMAVRDDWAVLAVILDKALESIPRNIRSQISQRWIALDFEKPMDIWAVLEVALKIGLPALIVILLFFIWNNKLRREVSKRKQAEKLLEATQSIARVGGWEIDIGTGKQRWTKEMYSLLDANPATSAPSMLSTMRFIHPDDSHWVKKAVQDSIKTATPYDMEFRVITAKGRHIWGRSQGGPIFDGKKFIKLAGAFKDITDRKTADTTREELIDELEYKNEELERFVYTVSHDLKSPLVTITGFLSLMKQDIAENNLDRLTQDSERIFDAVSRMKQLLDELLELSRVGRVENPTIKVSLSEVANEAMDNLQGLIEKTGTDVVVQPNLPKVFGDRTRLLEIFQNLIENALKFTAGQKNPRVKISTTRTKDEDVICVTDNGIGIEPQYRSKVFGLFEQLDPAIGGTGIGLALVKRIVETHNGNIWIESEGKGKGASICFTLPGKTSDCA